MHSVAGSSITARPGLTPCSHSVATGTVNMVLTAMPKNARASVLGVSRRGWVDARYASPPAAMPTRYTARMITKM